MSRMRIVGIDCGTEKTGYGVIDSDGRSHRFITAGVIRTKANYPLEHRLVQIAGELRSVISTFNPRVVSVEEVFHSVNTKSALKLAHVRGVALLLAAEAGLPVSEYSPLEVKDQRGRIRASREASGGDDGSLAARNRSAI